MVAGIEPVVEPCFGLLEIDAGDTYIYDDVGREDKQAREQAAAERIFKLLPPAQAQQVAELWDEYEAGETLHARYTKDLDKYDMILQAYEYEKEQGLDLSQFFNNIRFS